ncbi:MAG: acylphosphatase [Bacteroidota bacterium]
MIKHLDIIVEGKVQGVGFRVAAKAVADQLGVRGTVKNQKDGTVAIEAEADVTLLDMFLDFCREGSDTAQITAVQSHEGELKNYRNFEVLKRGLL